MNRLTKIIYADNSTVQFGYDFRGRRTSVTDQTNLPEPRPNDDDVTECGDRRDVPRFRNEWKLVRFPMRGHVCDR